MERKIGEVFLYINIKLKVIETYNHQWCELCYFNSSLNCMKGEGVSNCFGCARKDGKDVFFVEVK